MSFVSVAQLRGADGRGVELNLPSGRPAETTRRRSAHAAQDDADGGNKAGADRASAHTIEVSATSSTQTLTRDQALSLPFGEEMTARATKLHEALQAARSSSLTLARGNPQSLSRTYGERLRQARSAGVPSAGIDALLEELRTQGSDEVWGFTVRDDAAVYVAFTDAQRSRLLGVVVIARRGSEQVLMARAEST